jgi:putative ATPase
VPAHLRDAHYRGADELGHGAGYRYPHDSPAAWVAQRYLPDELGERRYYLPSVQGREARVLDWLDAARARAGGPPEGG